MARPDDVKKFNEKVFRSTVRAMKEKGEDVYADGLRHLQKTGKLHPDVDVRQKRESRNAMTINEKGEYILSNGIALPILNMFDGTGSTSHWLEDFFLAAERQYKLLEGARPRYNTQFASAVVQDVSDKTPVVQLSQFESDERSAKQVRLLQPASDGGDSPEDYDLGLVSGLYVYADLWTYYGLKGYFTLTLDEIGRGFVTRDDVESHLGRSLDWIQGGNKLQTSEVCKQLSKYWHVFVLQVPSRGSNMLIETTQWWSKVLDKSRVIQVYKPKLLAEVRAGLIYVTEASQPNKKGLTDFLQEGNQSLLASDIEDVWQMIQTAKEYFGAQSKLPGYDDIPVPGDVFSHFRHAWPIGHPRQSENVTPVETATTS